jgi:hypothetical protein
VANQSVRMTVLSPSTVMHIADVRFRGNEVNVRTRCGIVPRRMKYWTRVYDAMTGSRCKRCFPKGE